VVVYDLDLLRAVLAPLETDPISLIDPDAPLAFPITLETLEAVARGDPQLLNPDHGVELIQFPGSYPPELRWTRSPGRFRSATVEDVLGTLILE
jgi:hypothetical protein